LSNTNEERSVLKKPASPFSFFIAVVIGSLGALLVNMFLLDTYVVPSTSMNNTLQVKDYMVSVPLLDNREAPDRGSVIVFNPPGSWEQPAGTVFVKRVIGVAGDTVECCSADGKILLNGEPLDEPYLKNGVNDTNLTFSVTVPEGSLFVMGDNRLNSADSRYHADDPFIPVTAVLGQPHVIVWPFTRWGTI
jgi:signal peptidase I